MRNPVDRAYSHYQHSIRNEREPLSFEESLEAEPSRIGPELVHMLHDPFYDGLPYAHYSYRTRGIYITQIKHWIKQFSREQFLFLRFKDLIEDPDKVINQVFAFLDLPEHHFTNYPKYNGGGSYAQMSTETYEMLSDFYRPYNKQLEKFLGMRFNWD